MTLLPLDIKFDLKYYNYAFDRAKSKSSNNYCEQFSNITLLFFSYVVIVLII